MAQTDAQVVPVTGYISPKLRDELEAKRKANRRSKSAEIGMAIEAWLAQPESSPQTAEAA